MACKSVLRLLCALLFCASVAYSQESGNLGFGASDNFGVDSIDLATLTPTVTIPIISKPGAIPFSATAGISSFCYIAAPQSPPNSPNGIWCSSPLPYTKTSGMFYNMGPATHSTTNCTNGPGALVSDWYVYEGGAALQPNLQFTGSPHYFGSHQVSTCNSGNFTLTAVDGSGLVLKVTITATGGFGGSISYQLWNAAGDYTPGTGGNNSVTDPFGNTMSVSGTGTYTDTLNNATLTVNTTCTTLPCVTNNWTWHDTGGTARDITVTYGTALTVDDGFGCGLSGVQSGSASPMTFTYPDTTTMAIGLEQGSGGSTTTTGRINSITLRTGGTISYTYGSMLSCANAWIFPSTLSRATADGTTTYTLANVSGSVFTDTVLDPGKNKTVYTFSGVYANPLGTTGATTLTQVQRYQNTGTVSSPVYTLLSTDTYCYNNNSSSCSTTANAYPITQRDIYHYVGTGSTYMSHRTEIYDSYGNVTSDATADQITGQTITKTIVYAVNGSGSCSGIGATIHDHPCSITKMSGSTQLAKTTFAYNVNGAPTSKTNWVSSTDSLTTNYTPNTNGTMASVQMPNGQTTSYTYAATGSGGCNSFLQTGTSTTVKGVTLTTGKTWDCNGGVVLTTTDENGITPNATTYDAMFRPVHVYDNTNYETTYTYTATSTNSHSSMSSPNVVHDHTTYVDSLGRTIISQTQQGPGSSNYDTTSSTYGWNGTNFQTTKSVFCTQTSDQPCSTVASTILSNPAFGQVSSTDANSGTVTYAHNANDVSLTSGPAPSGEHTKVIQTEVDGFGRQKSICALETSGGTACGQVMGNSGILTSSSYSFGSGSTTTTTTRGSQTHTTVADALGRVTSVTTPEAGTETNVWDTSSSTQCNTTFNGSLVATTNNAGQLVCYYYDGLGRNTATWTTAGISGDYCKYFVYDVTANSNLTPPSGYPSSGANLKGRMVEAYTTNANNANDHNGNCPAFPLNAGDLESDEWFSYDADGRMTDMWEWTPNSGGYFHTTAGYNADGSLASLSSSTNSVGSGFTWGVDGEGRLNSMNYGSTSIVNYNAGNGFQYDAAGNVLNVPIGTSGDQDTYVYDSLENMTKYTFAVNGKSDSGTLTWNPIGSLGKLVIADTFNAGGSQTCNFSYDDVARLITDNCGSTLWNQTFDYGVNGGEYENLSKTGNPGTTWSPGYNTTNNEITGGSYDSAGRVLYDGVNSYSWNAYGNMVGIISGNHTVSCGTSGSNCATYDAFGRLVESNYGGTSFQQALLTPVGRVAFMNGQTVKLMYMPTPGGGIFEVDSGNQRFEHPDWLGTKRLSTDLSTRAWYTDAAYSPYGESYDGFNAANIIQDFTGLNMTVQFGLFDTPNRELMTNASRWISPDPAHASWNAYAYVTDPNTQTDPTGLDQCPPQCGGNNNSPIPTNSNLGNGDWTIYFNVYGTAGTAAYTNYDPSNAGNGMLDPLKDAPLYAPFAASMFWNFGSFNPGPIDNSDSVHFEYGPVGESDVMWVNAIKYGARPDGVVVSESSYSGVAPINPEYVTIVPKSGETLIVVKPVDLDTGLQIGPPEAVHGTLGPPPAGSSSAGSVLGVAVIVLASPTNISTMQDRSTAIYYGTTHVGVDRSWSAAFRSAWNSTVNWFTGN